MNYEELKNWLADSGRDPQQVYFAKVDGADSANSYPGDRWIIWEHDGLYDVGGEDRGRFVLSERFTSEDAACNYLHRVLTREGPIEESIERRRESQQVTAAEQERIRKLLGA